MAGTERRVSTGCWVVLAGAALLLALVVRSVARSVTGLPTARETSATPLTLPPGADALEPPGLVPLLDGLRPGAELIPGWPVMRLRVERPPPRFAVSVSHGETWLTLYGELKAGEKPAPRTTERYALFFSSPGGDQKPIEPATLERLLDALAARVRARELSVPTPPGM